MIMFDHMVATPVYIYIYIYIFKLFKYSLLVSPDSIHQVAWWNI